MHPGVRPQSARAVNGHHSRAMAGACPQVPRNFSFLLKGVPGALVLPGACPPDRGPETAPANHSRWRSSATRRWRRVPLSTPN